MFASASSASQSPYLSSPQKRRHTGTLTIWSAIDSTTEMPVATATLAARVSTTAGAVMSACPTRATSRCRAGPSVGLGAVEELPPEQARPAATRGCVDARDDRPGEQGAHPPERETSLRLRLEHAEPVALQQRRAGGERVEAQV